ncbi:MAG TPA: FecR family protein [Thermoanaerobaculia bacterium]
MSADGLPAGDDEAVRELLESAGRRPAVPAEDLARIEAAARAQWQELVAAGQKRRRAFRRTVVPLALAASLILAVAVRWGWKTEPPPEASGPIATVQLLKGAARMEGPPGQERREVTAGDALAAGTVIATGGGGSRGLLALRFLGGESVRLDAGTRVRLVSRTRLELEAGAVYVDSGKAAGGSLEVGTSWGSVREVGTQFEVRVEGGEDPALRVRVREGAVSLLRGGGSDSVAAGGELRLHRDGRVSRGAVEPRGKAWDWVLAAAPSLDIEGLTLREYLDWVSRETAWRLRYEDDALAGLVAGIRLHGTIEGMAPDESLSIVLPGSGLGYRIEGGTLLVTRARS